MIHLSQMESMLLWGELVEALHGKNGFGGHTAELYAYRFGRRYVPIPSVQQDNDRQAAQSLYALLRMFLLHYSLHTRRLLVNGRRFGVWVRDEFVFDHRVHVEVLVA